MRRAKHSNGRVKTIVLVLAAAVLLTATVGGVYAYISALTPALPNRFDPVEVTCEVVERFDGAVKQDVAIRNTGDIGAYIRAVVVATWVNESGEVYAVAPVEGTDYTVEWGNARWMKGADGFWYHQQAVAPQALTAVLIESATSAAPPTGYHLQLQVIATAIQAAPAEAVQEAWGVTVTDGVITPA